MDERWLAKGELCVCACGGLVVMRQEGYKRQAVCALADWDARCIYAVQCR